MATSKKLCDAASILRMIRDALGKQISGRTFEEERPSVRRRLHEPAVSPVPAMMIPQKPARRGWQRRVVTYAAERIRTIPCKRRSGVSGQRGESHVEPNGSGL